MGLPLNDDERRKRAAALRMSRERVVKRPSPETASPAGRVA